MRVSSGSVEVERFVVMEHLTLFFEKLSLAITLWAKTIRALDQAGQYELAWALMDIQPKATRIDTAC